MTEHLLAFFQDSPLALLILLGVLILCGLGLPVPEDIILVTAGLVAQEDGISWILTSVIMYFGVIAGDSIAFMIGRYFGMKFLDRPWVLRFIPLAKRQKVESLFEQYGSRVYFVARFLPGLRAAVFCTAGAMRARYLRFLLFDGLAALISVPFFVWLGHELWGRFGDDVGKLTGAISRAHSYSLWIGVAAVAVVVGLVWQLLRKKTRVG